MIGEQFGLVTITETAIHGRRTRWFGVCSCGAGRWFMPHNVRKNPPLTHRFCARGIQLELALDSPDVQAYEGAS